jgi:hypothetical protein
MTNAHVVDLLASKQGRKWVFKLRAVPGIGYEDDPGPVPTPAYPFESVLGVHPKFDLALLKVTPPQGATPPEPLTLASDPPRKPKGRKVYVLGYPAEDPRNGAALLRSIFLNLYEVKRLQPGTILKVFDKESLLHHDCSTLGGNSGSCVLDLETNQVIGLHFAGSYLKYNRAVALWKLRKDPLLKKAKVRFD